MKQEILSFLQKCEIVPSVYEGFIQFSWKKLNYIFAFSENDDPFYLRALLPGIDEYTKEEKENRRDVFLKLMADYKMVKFLEYCDNSDTINAKYKLWLSIEQMLNSMDNCNALFERIINTLQLVYKEYENSLNR